MATALKIEVIGDRVAFTFLPIHRMQREKVEESRGWLEKTASALMGRRISVSAVQEDQRLESPPAVHGAGSVAPATPMDLKATAMNDAAVQAMLDVFPAEIEDVEEI